MRGICTRLPETFWTYCFSRPRVNYRSKHTISHPRTLVPTQPQLVAKSDLHCGKHRVSSRCQPCLRPPKHWGFLSRFERVVGKNLGPSVAPTRRYHHLSGSTAIHPSKVTRRLDLCSNHARTYLVRVLSSASHQLNRQNYLLWNYKTFTVKWAASSSGGPKGSAGVLGPTKKDHLICLTEYGQHTALGRGGRKPLGAPVSCGLSLIKRPIKSRPLRNAYDNIS